MRNKNMGGRLLGHGLLILGIIRSVRHIRYRGAKCSTNFDQFAPQFGKCIAVLYAIDQYTKL